MRDKTDAEKKVEKEWADRLKRMLAYQQKFSKDWDRNEMLVFGDMPDTKGKASTPVASAEPAEKIKIAYAWGFEKAIATSVWVSNPTVLVESQKKDGELTAKLIKQIVDWDVVSMGLKDEANLLNMDAAIYGYGALIEVVLNTKNHYRWDFTGEEPVIERAEPESPAEDAGEPGEETPLKGEGDLLVEQEHLFRRIHPRDVLFDPRGKQEDLSDHNYIAVAIYPTVQELKEDKRLDLPDGIEKFPEVHPDNRSLANSPEMRPILPGSGGEEEDPAFRTIKVWEVHDKIHKKIHLLTDHELHYLGKYGVPYNLRNRTRVFFPVTLHVPHKPATGFYGIPEISLVSPQLSEMSRNQSMSSKDSQEKWRAFVTLKGLVNDTELAKATDTSTPVKIIPIDLADLVSVVGEAVTQNIDIQKLVMPIPDSAQKPDLPARMEELKSIVSHVLGYGPAERGGLVATRSAREAVIMNDAHQARLSLRFEAVARFYAQVIEKHIQLLQQTADLARVARIVGKDGAATWQEYTKEQIQGEFWFDVVAGSTAAKTTGTVRDEHLRLFQIMAPIVQQDGQSARKVLEWIMKDYSVEIDGFFSNVKAEAKKLAVIMAQVEQGQADPAMVLEQASRVVMAELSPAELQQVQALIQQNMSGGAPVRQPGAPAGDQNPLATGSGVMGA